MILSRSRWCKALLSSIVVAFGSFTLGATSDQPDVSLDELLALYRTYKLPLPSDDAKLVRFESGWRTSDKSGKEVRLDYLGFLVKPATSDHPAVVLVGTREITAKSTASKITPVATTTALAKDGTIKEYEAMFGLTSTLALAIQCKSRGWDDLARGLLENRRGREFIRDPMPGGTLLPLRPSVAHMAWKHWENALVDPETDRAEIAKRVKALLASEPSFTDYNRGLLAVLEVTLKPSQAKPGSIEAMIDGLANVSDIYEDSRSSDPLITKLALLGFEAVPALIEHWDDPRLTRGATPVVANSKGSLIPVCGAVRGLVTNLAGEGLEAKTGEIKKADVLAWWAKAGQTGEEAYLVAHVLPTGANEREPNTRMLRIIARKYPWHLPAIYRAVLEKQPSVGSTDAVEAIGGSSLPREIKCELLLRGASNPGLEHRRPALWALKDVDPEQFLQALIATLESLPKTPKEPYWSCREATFAHLVMETDDPRAWITLEKVAKRSDVGLRMEFMSPFNYTYIANRQRRQRLEFLSHFLDDDEVRDAEANAKRYEGPIAAGEVPRIEVRNFAAWQIASILKMGVDPDRRWTAEQWTELRIRVRQRLVDELAQKPEQAVR
jgi:hypothetical protein